jgi:hypothetical protein
MPPAARGMEVLARMGGGGVEGAMGSEGIGANGDAGACE